MITQPIYLPKNNKTLELIGCTIIKPGTSSIPKNIANTYQWISVARMEAKIDTAESEIQIRNEISKTLGLSFNEQRVKKLEQNAEVQRRLKEITKKANT